MKRIILSALLLVLVITITTGRAQQQVVGAWEYKFEYEIREKKANELGAQGWELVAVSPTSSTSSVNEYVFRRAK